MAAAVHAGASLPAYSTAGILAGRVPAMADFTSALYLGLQHPSATLPGWSALTLGRPAALEEPPGACAVATELAALQGCEAATLLPSTLHLFWDLFGILGRQGATIYVEATTYAIARWGVQHGEALGAPVHRFTFGDAAGLERLMRRGANCRGRPLIVCDAVRPGSDRQSPLARYASLAAQYGGCLVLDDTQALGVLGYGARAGAPMGFGGGGSLRHQALGGAHIIVGASLAKGFGVPVAALSGSRAMVRLFEERSQTRIHASPPSAAAIHAAGQALALNRRCGDALRLRLVQRVRRFRQRLAQWYLRATGGDFPVQSLAAVPGIDAASLHAGLLQRRVRTVLHRDARGATLSFILTATHSAGCIDRAVTALAQTVHALSGGRRAGATFLETS